MSGDSQASGVIDRCPTLSASPLSQRGLTDTHLDFLGWESNPRPAPCSGGALCLTELPRKTRHLTGKIASKTNINSSTVSPNTTSDEIKKLIKSNFIPRPPYSGETTSNHLSRGEQIHMLQRVTTQPQHHLALACFAVHLTTNPSDRNTRFIHFPDGHHW